MWEFMTNTITIGTVIGVIMAGIARFLPNDKLYAWGTKVGNLFDSIGNQRMGSATWERIEHFLVNSIGEFLRGFKNGLDDTND